MTLRDLKSKPPLKFSIDNASDYSNTAFLSRDSPEHTGDLLNYKGILAWLTYIQAHYFNYIYRKWMINTELKQSSCFSPQHLKFDNSYAV